MCWCICHQQKVVGRILVVTLLIDAVQQMNVAQRLLSVGLETKSDIILKRNFSDAS
jgi:hypothetical protein